MRAIGILLYCGVMLAETRLHHVHLLAPDPAAVVDFYVGHFAASRGKVLGLDAVQTARTALVVSAASEVKAGPTALWHLAWGATDMRAEYMRQLDRGTRFTQPIEQLLPGVFLAYVAAPQGVEVEINTAKTNEFTHVHLYSRYPHVAGEWYARYLGLRPTRPLSSAPVQVGRYRFSSAAYLDAGGVSVLIAPMPEGVTELLPSEGSAVDHLAFAVEGLDAKLLDLRKSGARILAMPREIAPGVRAAMVQGPDRMKIELIEGQ